MKIRLLSDGEDERKISKKLFKILKILDPHTRKFQLVSTQIISGKKIKGICFV